MKKKLMLKGGAIKGMSLEEAYECFKPLLIWLTRQNTKDQAIYDDLYQEACIGLIQAYRAYDIDRGYLFTTLLHQKVVWTIKRAMRDTNPRAGKLIRPPRDRSKFKHSIVYLNTVVSDDGEGGSVCLGDMLETERNLEEEIVAKVAMKEYLKKQHMTPAQRRVFEIMEAYDGDISQADIAKQTGISQAHVSRTLRQHRQQYMKKMGVGG